MSILLFSCFPHLFWGLPSPTTPPLITSPETNETLQSVPSCRVSLTCQYKYYILLPFPETAVPGIRMALSDADVQKQIKHMMAFIEQVGPDHHEYLDL